MLRNIKSAVVCAFATLLCGFSGAAFAQGNYPSRPIHVVVPFTAGGGLDFTTRLIGKKLEDALGQPIIVDDRPGAGGVLGTRNFIGTSAPDGYTLLVATAGEIAIAPSLNPAVNYDPLKDLAPVALVVRAPNILAVNIDIPAKTLSELIAYAKANPDKVTYSTSGVGTAHHLIGEYVNKLAGIKTLHVPFKGASEQVLDVAAKRVSMTYASPAALESFIEKGVLRPIAVTTPERLASIPNLPAIRETLPGFEVNSWFAMFAPAGTPAPIVARLNKEVVQILKDPAIAKRLSEAVGTPASESPAEFGAILAKDIANFRRVINEVKIKVD